MLGAIIVGLILLVASGVTVWSLLRVSTEAETAAVAMLRREGL